MFVWGVEADFQGADIKDSISIAGPFATVGNNTTGGTRFDANDSIDWFGTVRARLGVAYDRALIYATGGLIYGRVEVSQNTVFSGTQYARTWRQRGLAGPREAELSSPSHPTGVASSKRCTTIWAPYRRRLSARRPLTASSGASPSTSREALCAPASTTASAGTEPSPREIQWAPGFALGALFFFDRSAGHLGRRRGHRGQWGLPPTCSSQLCPTRASASPPVI